MTMLGKEELVKLFPEFKDTIQPSGIDLKVDKIYRQTSAASLIDNLKNIAEVEEVECIDEIYTLKAKTSYLCTIKGKIQIPVGYSMLYLPRSTLLRSFITVDTAVGDPGFYGTLRFMITNNGEYDYKLKKEERIAQAVVFKVEGSGEYTGSYREKK